MPSIHAHSDGLCYLVYPNMKYRKKLKYIMRAYEQMTQSEAPKLTKN